MFPALLGGAYSSTATTVVLAKRQRESARLVPNCRPALSRRPASCTCGWRSSSPCSACRWRPPWRRPLLCCSPPAHSWPGANGVGPSAAPARDLAIPAANPLQLTTALLFAALFVVISLATVWVERLFGQAGHLHPCRTRRRERHRPVRPQPRPRRRAGHEPLGARRRDVDRRLRQ